MKKLLLALALSVVLLLTGADCQGSKPNPKPQPGPSWIEGCANLPEGCPLQSGRQPAPSGSAG